MNTIMEAFASTCEETARWREEKADQFGDDRNRRTAEALRSAAVWARTAEDAEDRLSVLFPDKIQRQRCSLMMSSCPRTHFSSTSEPAKSSRRTASTHRSPSATG